MAKKAVAKRVGKSASPATKASARKVTGSAARAKAAAPAAEPLTHRLDALLHTMRCITQHEDQLCTLLHDARRTGSVSATLRRELQSILAELPAEEYTHDLHAVLEITDAA